MSDDQEFSSDGECTFIEWFCTLEDHFWFCEIDREFIQDPTNLHGLKHQFPKFNQAIKALLRQEGPKQHELDNPQFLELYQETTDIYGLIHARFILTPKGLNLMRQKYLRGDFGLCPRALCEDQNVIPIGVNEELRVCRVKVFCPKCQDIYHYQPKKKCINIDGAYFGSSFPHVLLMSFEDLKTKKSQSTFEPQIFGFKIHGKSGSIINPVPSKEKVSPSSIIEDKSLAKTSVSRHKRKPKNKNK